MKALVCNLVVAAAFVVSPSRHAAALCQRHGSTPGDAVAATAFEQLWSQLLLTVFGRWTMLNYSVQERPSMIVHMLRGKSGRKKRWSVSHSITVVRDHGANNSILPHNTDTIARYTTSAAAPGTPTDRPTRELIAGDGVPALLALALALRLSRHRTAHERRAAVHCYGQPSSNTSTHSGDPLCPTSQIDAAAAPPPPVRSAPASIPNSSRSVLHDVDPGGAP